MNQIGKETTEAFIIAHLNDNVRRLALQSAQHRGIDMPYALSQIAGWQTAREKLPSWAAVPGIVYPPHLSMEQCSSEATALYKLRVAKRLLQGAEGGLLVDLTGGFGVDCACLSRAFASAVYVERQPQLCEAARHNFRLLGIDHVQVAEGDGTAYLRTMERATMVYLDPARRDANGSKTHAIADCSPDVTAIKGELLQKARWVVLKLSPMLDWHQAVAELADGAENAVREVHIVSVDNECKELLLVLSAAERSEKMMLCCVNLHASGEEVFSLPAEEALAAPPIGGDSACPCTVAPGIYLYEPNASIMKAGCFGALSRRYGVAAVGANSHLFVSPSCIDHFPGRRFQISSVSSMNKHQLKAALQGISQANIATRNFPMTVADLRRKLRLRDGGSTYIFATTVDAAAISPDSEQPRQAKQRPQHLLLVTSRLPLASAHAPCTPRQE